MVLLTIGSGLPVASRGGPGLPCILNFSRDLSREFGRLFPPKVYRAGNVGAHRGLLGYNRPRFERSAFAGDK
jgi:hypothetical protein